jgi:hypothetical protein
MYSTLRLAIASLSCLIVATSPAYAYLDPGTGSILLQGLIAGIAGGIVAFKLYWSKVKQFLPFAKAKDHKADGEAGS